MDALVIPKREKLIERLENIYKACDRKKMDLLFDTMVEIHKWNVANPKNKITSNDITAENPFTDDTAKKYVI